MVAGLRLETYVDLLTQIQRSLQTTNVSGLNAPAFACRPWPDLGTRPQTPGFFYIKKTHSELSIVRGYPYYESFYGMNFNRILPWTLG